MRLATIAVSICIAFVTQSCRIEMPSLVQLIGSHDTKFVKTIEGLRQSAYDFSKSKALQLQTGFKDTLIIGDDPESFHGMHMQWDITRKQVPERNTMFFEDLGGSRWRGNTGLEMLVSDEWRWLRKKTKVAHVPYLIPFVGPRDAELMASTNIVFVIPVGNMSEHLNGDRDLYNNKRIDWNYGETPERVQLLQESYQNLLRVYETGRALAVTSAVPTGRGEEIVPNEWVVSCGDIKEACFTVVPRQNTSSASARLAAMSFYVAQFWETAEEVVDVLEACAIDVGEPGVDREYGKGIANLLCPRVLQKELEVVSTHLGEREEKRKETQGGNLEGIWRAENTEIQVHIPRTIKTTLEAESAGTTEGTITFTEGEMTADFTTKASIKTVFLLSIPIEATAEETTKQQGVYTTEGPTLKAKSLEYTYTATEDSLFLVQTFTLEEVFTLLPGYLGTVMTSEAIENNDPITVTMSFSKVTPPSTPENLRAETVTDSTITLMWETGETEVSGYRVNRYTDSTCEVVSETKETKEQAVTFKSLREDTEHYFSVEASNTAGWSITSACLTVRTEKERIPGDFDNNRVVDFADFLLFSQAFGANQTDQAFNEAMDLVPDGMINFADFLVFIELFKEGS